MPIVNREPTADFITLKEFIQRAGIGRRTLFRMLAADEVRNFYIRHRRFIPASELARLSSAQGAYVPYRKPSKKSKSVSR
jgi:AraC-like DNA-binding protein